MPEQTLAVVIERIENLKDHLTEKLDRIEGQTIKTNGRVSKLEVWKNRIIGGFLVVSAVMIPVFIRVFF